MLSTLSNLPADSSDPPKRVKPAAHRLPVIPQTSFEATAVLLGGLALTALTVTGETPTSLARYGAIGAGVSLAASLAVEARQGWRNLLRPDLVCLIALYYLTFFEFLFPQPKFDEFGTDPTALRFGIRIALLGFAGLAIGRCFMTARHTKGMFADFQMPAASLIGLFWFCFIGGYLYMLSTVDFNPMTMVHYFMEPRFAAPWTRGQFGDAKAMLFELGAVLYLVPPLAGVILGRRKKFSGLSVTLVVLGLLFTLFYGFSSGTRNLIGSYLATFLAAYLVSARSSWREHLSLFIVAVVIMGGTTVYGLRFRGSGLNAYIRQGPQETGAEAEVFFVDYNLQVITELTTVFPKQAPYLGYRVPYWLLVRPVPRALWPGKPDGQDISPDQYLGIAEGTTIAATFIGESYMGAGWIGVLLVGGLFGFLGQWWVRHAYSASELGIVIYGSGFFAAVISMRSLYQLPVAILPTLAAIVLAYFFSRSRQARARKIPATRRPATKPTP